MNIFKTFTLTWWQGSLFKLSAVSFGILLGFYFQAWLFQWITLFWILFLLPGAYVTYIWMKQ